MTDLQKHTKLSRGAIYHHFKSKEEIQCKVIDLYLLPALKTMNIPNINTFKQPLKESIKLSLEKRASFILKLQKINNENLNDFYFYKLAFQADEFYPGFREKIQELKQVEEKTWIKVLNFAIQKKEIKQDINIEDAAKMLIIIPQGLGIDTSIDASSLTFDALKRIYMLFYDLIKI